MAPRPLCPFRIRCASFPTLQRMQRRICTTPFQPTQLSSNYWRNSSPTRAARIGTESLKRLASSAANESDRGSKTAPGSEILVAQDEQEDNDVRLPRNVQAAYLRPLKRNVTDGLPVCDLQLRSYSVRNVEFYADFALRAAYYLKMPASGPIPLPKLIQRWTVPRSNFVHKKSQENFERVTLRRLIQIKDADPETVQIWLAFLRKHAFYGVGMKANVWHHETLNVGESMEKQLDSMRTAVDRQWALYGREGSGDIEERVVDKVLD